jgi:multidrug efflux pump subunit AcrA (membrane-fusion protein)
VDDRERTGDSIRHSAGGSRSVVRSITATGTVNPVIVVQVGTYDSGPIIAIYADFNSPVRAGQLIAKIDPRPFTLKVHEAQAALGNSQSQLAKDQADLAYKKLLFDRDSNLMAENVISQDTLDNARSAYQQAASQVALDGSMVSSRSPTSRRRKSISTIRTSSPRSTARWSRAMSTSARPSPPAFRPRRCF